MRTVTVEQTEIRNMLKVSDDPLGIIKNLFGHIFSEDIIDQTEEMFASNGKGYHFPDAIHVSRVREIEDLPEYMWENPPVDFIQNEIWIIERTRYGGGGMILIEGEELRHIVKEAKKLWIEFIAIPSQTVVAVHERYKALERQRQQS